MRKRFLVLLFSTLLVAGPGLQCPGVVIANDSFEIKRDAGEKRAETFTIDPSSPGTSTAAEFLIEGETSSQYLSAEELRVGDIFLWGPSKEANPAQYYGHAGVFMGWVEEGHAVYCRGGAGPGGGLCGGFASTATAANFLHEVPVGAPYVAHADGGWNTVHGANPNDDDGLGFSCWDRVLGYKPDIVVLRVLHEDGTALTESEQRAVQEFVWDRMINGFEDVKGASTDGLPVIGPWHQSEVVNGRATGRSQTFREPHSCYYRKDVLEGSCPHANQTGLTRPHRHVPGFYNYPAAGWTSKQLYGDKYYCTELCWAAIKAATGINIDCGDDGSSPVATTELVHSHYTSAIAWHWDGEACSRATSVVTAVIRLTKIYFHKDHESFTNGPKAEFFIETEIGQGATEGKREREYWPMHNPPSPSLRNLEYHPGGGIGRDKTTIGQTHESRDVHKDECDPGSVTWTADFHEVISRDRDLHISIRVVEQDPPTQYNNYNFDPGVWRIASSRLKSATLGRWYDLKTREVQDSGGDPDCKYYVTWKLMAP